MEKRFPERFLQKEGRGDATHAMSSGPFERSPHTHSRIKLASPLKTSTFRQPMLLLDRSLSATGKTG